MGNLEQSRIHDRVSEIVEGLVQEAFSIKKEGGVNKSSRLKDFEKMYLMNKQFTQEFDFTDYDKRVWEATEGLD